MTTTYQLRSTYAATATALLLGLPPVGHFDSTALAPTHAHEYESFAEASKTISDAFASSAYNRATPEVLFSLMTEVASRLVEESQPINRAFAKVIKREFWNLLQ